MFRPVHLRSILLATMAVFLTAAGTVAAQGLMFGKVTDQNGLPLEGVSVAAESEQDPVKRTVTTNEKGEFTIVGVRTGAWYLTFTKDGYLSAAAGQNISGLERSDPINVRLEAGLTLPDGADIDTEGIQADLEAAAAMSSSGDHAGALAAYEALSEQLPALTAIRIQIAGVYNDMRDYEKALAELDAILAADPTNQRAKMDRATTLLLNGDIEAAEAALTEVAGEGGASAETYYNLGEVLFSQGEADAAAGYYEKSAAANATWGKPLFKLALVSLNKGDMETATTYLEKVIDVDPNSEDAGSAKLMLQQLNPQ